MAMSTTISTTETAKLVRAALKARFPGQKFSVTSSRYSGGSSITVSWTDGPTTEQVDEVTRLYNGASFDGMIDLKSYHDSELVDEETGEVQKVHFGADFIHTQRRVSDEWEAELIAELVAYTDEPYDPNRDYKVSVWGKHQGGGSGLARDLHGHLAHWGSQIIWQLASGRSRFGECDHSQGDYGCGGFSRCKGCGTVLP